MYSGTWGLSAHHVDIIAWREMMFLVSVPPPLVVRWARSWPGVTSKEKVSGSWRQHTHMSSTAARINLLAKFSDHWIFLV